MLPSAGVSRRLDGTAGYRDANRRGNPLLGREEWYRATGKTAKVPGRNRIVKWLRDPRTDSAEYKAYGNSVCVYCVFFVLAGIVWAEETEEDAN